MFASLSLIRLLLSGALALASLFVSLRSFIIYTRCRRTALQHGCKPPPKYQGWDPLFGLDIVYNGIQAINRKNFLNWRRSQYETYGYTHSCKVGAHSAICTVEPENIITVLSTKFKDFVLGTPRQRAFSPVLKNSILVADGLEWEHSRAFLKPSFSRSQVGDLATLEIHVKNLIAAIPHDGSSVDLLELFLRYTADVTTDFMLGESIGSLPRPDAFGGKLTQACEVAQRGMARRLVLGRFADFIPQPALYRSVKLAHDYVDGHVENAIQEKRSRNLSEKNEIKQSSKYFFLKELVQLTEDRVVLRDQLLGIFVAGRDTTATLLSNLFFELARRPDLTKQLQEEVRSLEGRQPTLDELKGMKLLSYCMNESKHRDMDRQNLMLTRIFSSTPVLSNCSWYYPCCG